MSELSKILAKILHRCSHPRTRGIYGDEIIFATPNFNRLQCLDCGKFLDGPVSLATHKEEMRDE